MLTIRLKIKENALDRVMHSLNAFTSDELMVIHEDQSYLDNQKYLQKELEEINNGNEEFVSHEELESSLNEVITKYEDRL
ncbi:MAG: tRNA pseudouridine synthase A [Saprospiraceae bacterium]|nr:tRNA pseudouridine synthase A [Saprospiraceae bacterium]